MNTCTTMNKFKIIVIVFFLLMGKMSSAQNPILRENTAGFLFAADPSAEVFGDKVYVYCSHDQPDATNYESMKDYVILESSDMKTWTNHGVSLDPQLDKGFEYAQSNMNAPDAAYKKGWYYWYFPSDVTHVGVAKSKTPVGPWESAVSNEFTTIFDPTVFVDDDGQAYIFGNDHWVDIGEPGSHIMGAKLKENMIELDGPWVRLSKEVVNEAVHVFKRNGIYYFSARVGPVTQYWMADSPLPQYAVFKGELAPNSPESPNHTSVIEFKNEWYLFYHRGDVNHGSRYKRSVCFDKITFRPDGTIEPVVYTLDKEVAITVPTYAKRVPKENKDKMVSDAKETKLLEDGVIRYEAEIFDNQLGIKLENQNDGDQRTEIVQLSNGDWTSYNDIKFGNGDEPFSFRVRIATPNEGGEIVLRVNSPTGTIIGTIPVPATGSATNYATLSTKVNRILGSQTLYLCYRGKGDSLLNLNWFEWTPSLKKINKPKI
ncbi:family 43 glycosylhydrolase [Flavobacterium algicola]|uniref:family 43 glycosylhydrolase n=1 Tax=Flavobacterium algicola TaxID=556529 RepID=UPI001EFC5B2A|nr:family 43 glycosylhydrolase [Flavobacterium algicola]MCG9792342.1 family 43 glycosylhydrolase [Flavobacterium algicola]